MIEITFFWLFIEQSVTILHSFNVVEILSLMQNRSGQVLPESSNPITSVRRGEKMRSWFRGERFLQINHQWYFMTREGSDVGPFVSREVAESALCRFIECIQKGFTVERASAIAKEGDWALVMYQ